MVLILKRNKLSKKSWTYLLLFIFFSLFFLSSFKTIVIDLLYFYGTFHLIEISLATQMILTLGFPILFFILFIKSKKKV